MIPIEIKPKKVSQKDFEITLTSIANKVDLNKPYKEKIEMFKELLKEFYSIIINYYMTKEEIDFNKINNVISDFGVTLSFIPDGENFFIIFIDYDLNKKRSFIKYKGVVVDKNKILEKENLNQYKIITPSMSLDEVISIFSKSSGIDKNLILDSILKTFAGHMIKIRDEHETIFGF
jgi:hypothetical protein